MKMQAMDDYLIEKGFNVYRFYDGVCKEYFFDISKEGIGTSAYFKYDGQKSQEDFLDNLIETWEKEYEKFNSRPKPTPYDLYQLKRELAVHGGKAQLIVNENVYPVRINEVTIDSLAGEIPKVSVEGDLMSFVPESRTCLARYKDYCKHDVEMTREMYRIMVNSLYGNPVTRANPFAIKKLIINYPATIVLWADGTKTVVKCQKDEVYDPEKGFAMAFMKKALGNKGNYYYYVRDNLDKAKLTYY